MGCFCRCASSNPWNDYVRSCLACSHRDNCDPYDSHRACYLAADAAGLPGRSYVELALCVAQCLFQFGRRPFPDREARRGLVPFYRIKQGQVSVAQPFGDVRIGGLLLLFGRARFAGQLGILLIVLDDERYGFVAYHAGRGDLEQLVKCM